MQYTQMRNKAVIAVVDDDESLRTALEGLLRATGYLALTYAAPASSSTPTARNWPAA